MEDVDVDINIGSDAVASDKTDDTFADEDGVAVSPLAPATDEPIIEAQETEISEDVSDIEETSDDIDETEEDIETLESIHQHLTKSLDNGGLDKVSFEMFHITMNHIYRKYGITAEAVMPSMEAFGEDNYAQTVVSLEMTKQTIDNFKKGAAEFLKKLWFRVKTFVMNVIKLNFALTKRVQAVLARAEKMENNADAKEIRLYSAGRLHIGGKIPDSDTIVKTYSATVSELSSDVGSIREYFEELVKVHIAMTRVSSQGDEPLPEFKTAAEALGVHIGRQNEINKHLTFQDAKLEEVDFGTDGDDNVTIKGMRLSTEPGPTGDDTLIKPLSIDQIKTVCNDILESIKGAKDLAEDYTKKDMERKITGDNNKTAKTTTNAIKTAMQLHGRILNYYNSLNKGMLDYCAQSIQAHGAKAEAAEPAAAETATA